MSGEDAPRWAADRAAGEPVRLAEGLPAGTPPELEAALARHGTAPARHWREGDRAYVRAGAAFARWTTTSEGAWALAHEVAVRAAVGSWGALKAPPVLASGAGWLVDRAVEPRPLRGAEAIDAVLAAVAELLARPVAGWPPGPGAPAGGGRGGGLAAQVRAVARSPVGARRAVAARAGLLRRGGLEPRPAHGDLQPGNLLWADDGLWVIDWELARVAPAGTDLITLWAVLDDEGDRERLWRGTVALLGPEHERTLRRRRRAAAVRLAEGLLAAEDPIDRDPELAAALLSRAR